MFFHSFISVTIIKLLKFKFYILFGTHTLLDKTLKALQLPVHLSKLIANG